MPFGYPHNADRFGGYAHLPFTGTILRGESGRFHTGIMGSRTVVVDPDGNVWPWLLVWNFGVPGSPSPKPSDAGASAQTYRNQKYVNNEHWSQAALARLKQYGFTGTHGIPTYGVTIGASHHSIGGYAHSWYNIDPRPIGGTVDWQTSTATRGFSPFPQPTPVPNTYLLSPSRYGMDSPSAFKTMMRMGSGVSVASITHNQTYYLPPGNIHFPDIFDPAWVSVAQAYCNGPINNKWIIGSCMDDADFLRGFGAGPEFTTDQPRVNQPHVGYSIAIGKPWLTEATNWDGTTFSYTPAQGKVYCKYRWRDYLTAKYGTVSALNAAWGTGGFYTTFDMQDEIGHTSWGSGTGVMDEDGRHAWFGGTTGGTQRSSISIGLFQEVMSPPVNATLLADLDQMFLLTAEHYFSTFKNALATVKPGLLYLGQAVFGGWGCPPHKMVLRAANQYVDVAQCQMVSTVNPQDNAAKAAHVFSELTSGVAVAMWWGNVANTDAAFEGYPGGFSTQGTRAAAYDQGLKILLSTISSQTGLAQGVGLSLWELYDNWSEKKNWGWMSIRHNPYDSLHSSPTPPAQETVVIPIPISPFSVTRTYTNISEDNIYGNYTGPSTQTHLDIQDLYTAQVGGASPPPPPPPPEEFMATLNVTITNEDQLHTIDYTAVRVRFQRSQDQGVTWVDVQSNDRPLGTVTDSYAVPSGSLGMYRAGAALTDGTQVGTEVFSGTINLALLATPTAISLNIVAP